MVSLPCYSVFSMHSAPPEFNPRAQNTIPLHQSAILPPVLPDGEFWGPIQSTFSWP